MAVFDVDGTLFRRGLVPALTRRMVEEGIFTEEVRDQLGEDYYAWVERRGSYENYDRKVVELFLRELEGVGLEAMRRCAEREVATRGRRWPTGDTPSRCTCCGRERVRRPYLVVR